MVLASSTEERKEESQLLEESHRDLMMKVTKKEKELRQCIVLEACNLISVELMVVVNEGFKETIQMGRSDPC